MLVVTAITALITLIILLIACCFNEDAGLVALIFMIITFVLIMTCYKDIKEQESSNNKRTAIPVQKVFSVYA